MNEHGQSFKVKHSATPTPTSQHGVKLAMVHTIDDDFAAEVARLCATPVSDEPWQAFLDAHVSLDDPGRASR